MSDVERTVLGSVEVGSKILIKYECDMYPGSVQTVSKIRVNIVKHRYQGTETVIECESGAAFGPDNVYAVIKD